MTFLTNNLVLTLQQINENAGRLCFDNIVNASTIAATSYLIDGATSFPATNMANPATSFGWEAASTADQTITITNDTAKEIDYVGLARHNLNQAGLELRVRFNGVTVSNYASVSDQQAILFLFGAATPSLIQIDIRGATDAAKIAVMYCGKSLQLQRNIYVGHTPINFGRDRQAFNGVSQSGEYLGEVVLSETLSNSVDLNNLDPLWYRGHMDTFFARAVRAPYFFAWRPGTYPAEVAYCWLEGNPRPVNQHSNGMMNVSWNQRGIR